MTAVQIKDETVQLHSPHCRLTASR